MERAATATLTADGKPSPTLRLKPGDQLVIHFKNDLVDLDTTTPAIDRAARRRTDLHDDGAGRTPAPAAR